LTIDVDIPEVVAWHHFICIPGWKNIPRLSGKLQQRNQWSKHSHPLPSTLFFHLRQSGSGFAQDLTGLASSPQYSSVRSLAELFARATWSFVAAKTPHLWLILNETVRVFEEMSGNLWDTWRYNPWVDVQTEEEIPESARETLTQAWGVLKTILFVTVMVQQSVITATIYLPPPSSKIMSSLEPNVTPASVACTLLQTLSNLSFVITKFGGVTSTARTSVFPQLRRLFYSALDVLSTSQAASEKFVIGLCQPGKHNPTSSKVMENAKMAFSLTCIEQLVPNVEEDGIQNQILNICIPYVIHLLFVLVLVSRATQLEGTFGITRTGRFMSHLTLSFSLCWQPTLKEPETGQALLLPSKRARERI
jgi:hypothetical protein